MKSRAPILIGFQIVIVLTFGLAALAGGLSFGPGGISIRAFAHDWIALVTLLAALGSCVLATMALADLSNFHRKIDSLVFTFAFVVAVLATMPYANASDSTSIEGMPLSIVTYPIYFWLACLLLLLARACARGETNKETLRPVGSTKFPWNK